MRRTTFALIVLGLCGGFCSAAVAQQIQGMENGWKAADRCAQDAFAKYPDYTPEENLKREAFRRACLRDHDLVAPDAPFSQQNLGARQ